MPRKRNHDEIDLAEIATAQGSVVSLAQLREVDVSAGAAARRARAGTLHRVHRGVYAVGHRSLGRIALLRAALLSCGEGAVVSHLTAAAHWGLRDKWPVLIDVTVPIEAGRKIDGIRCRRCRYPDPAEVGEHREVICTTPARTIIDLAGVLSTASLRRVVERAAVLKLLDLQALDEAIARAKGRRGLRALQAILADWRTPDGRVPDVRSDFEALVLPQLVALGLPRPTCNQKLVIDGEPLTVDFLWKQQRLVVETDGRETHATPFAFQRDRWRDQHLVAAGYRVARATWDQIHHELDDVVSRISRALAQHA